MNMAQRIQNLRKSRGFSQEELADIVGVSRQAVSKWESEQSLPEPDKIVMMSEYFGVSCDYLLKGTESPENGKPKDGEAIGNILYIGSAALMLIGLLCAFAGWHEEQTLDAVFGSMIIQAVGIAGYFIGRVLSKAKAPFAVDMINISIVSFIPVSMLTGFVSLTLLGQGTAAPYPNGTQHILLFIFVYAAVLAASYFILKRQKNKHGA